MRRSQSDFEEELRAHIALEIDQLMAEGMSPTDARTAAHRKFGNLAAAQERHYFARRASWIDSVRADVKYGSRSLRRFPALSLVSILVLALGLGAAVTIFG